MTRILVVDDCEELREVVAKLLDAEGFAVSVANDSEEALLKLSGESYDAVLCDLVLPLSQDSDGDSNDSAMVGVHCINEITKRHPKLPVIAISGELVGSPLGAVKNFGAKATLSKPFGRDELMSTLSSVLPQR